MSTKLSLANLGTVSHRAAVPNYQRSDLKAGIVHFGIGNFHRAHQAVYLDDLFNLGRDHDWAIVGAGVLPSDTAGRDRLKEQDYLTTVVEQDAGHMEARVTGAMVDYLTPGDTDAILDRLADPAIRIVSLTITEGADSVLTRERFSEAFRNPMSSRVLPMYANVCALNSGGAPANDAVVCCPSVPLV